MLFNNILIQDGGFLTYFTVRPSKQPTDNTSPRNQLTDTNSTSITTEACPIDLGLHNYEWPYSMRPSTPEIQL